MLQSTHIIDKSICEKIENRTKSLPGIRRHSPTKDGKYTIAHVECKVIILPQEQNSFTHDNLFLGQLPKIIVLGLVDNRAFNGDISLNPYNFQHCNLNYLAVHVDGQQVPWAPLQPPFSGSSYIRAFYTQFIGGDGISSDTENTIG